MQPRTFKLSPSDFAFLWEECKRCFWLKVVAGILRPRMPMPKIFTAIDAGMKAFLAGKRTEEILPGLPPGVFAFGERWVEGVVAVPGHRSQVRLKGRFDVALHLDDRSFGIVDGKTASARSEHVPLYGRQLHGYAYCLEHPAPGSLGLSPVTRLGLLVFEPGVFRAAAGGGFSLGGPMEWIEVPRDDAGFLHFLADVLTILEEPSPPPASPSCEWCRYRGAER